MSSPDALYFWGQPDALINWCERDHSQSAVIAEFCNALSNAFFIFAGLLALRLGNKHAMPATYRLAAHSILLTGASSFLFHASLRWWLQKLDEVFETILVLAVFHGFESKPHLLRLHIGAAVVGILLIPAWFCELHLVGIALLAFAQLRSLGWHLLRDEPALYFSLFGGIRNCFLVAGAAWLIDRVACEQLQRLPGNLPNPQLHAFGWHLFCALGISQTMLALCVLQLKRRPVHPFHARRVRLARLLGFVPFGVEADLKSPFD